MREEKQSEEKQIKEMARIICGNNRDCRDCGHNSAVRECGCLFYAKRIYEQDYRKRRHASWVTTAETEDGVTMRYTHRCTDCGYFYKTVCPCGDDYCHKCGAKMHRKEDE